jgi:hypothetical protein
MVRRGWQTVEGTTKQMMKWTSWSGFVGKTFA